MKCVKSSVSYFLTKLLSSFCEMRSSTSLKRMKLRLSSLNLMFGFLWQVKIVKFCMESIAVDITFNQHAALSTLCFLEQVLSKI